MNRYILYDLRSVHNLKARIVTALMTVLFASPALSQDIAEACERVAMFEFGISEVHSGDIQAFPELDPPRVRMRIRGEGPSDDLIADALARALGQLEPDEVPMRDYGQVSCQFESATSPFGLTAFECSGLSCSISDLRLEELRVLLHREYAAEGEVLGPLPRIGGSWSSTGSVTDLSEAIQQCWNLGVLSSDAQRITVTVGFGMSSDGRHERGSIRLIDASGGNEALTEQAFDAARRAIIRCEGDGYPLLPGYSGGREDVRIIFDAPGMKVVEGEL